MLKRTFIALTLCLLAAGCGKERATAEPPPENPPETGSPDERAAVAKMLDGQAPEFDAWADGRTLVLAFDKTEKLADAGACVCSDLPAGTFVELALPVGFTALRYVAGDVDVTCPIEGWHERTIASDDGEVFSYRLPERQSFSTRSGLEAACKMANADGPEGAWLGCMGDARRSNKKRIFTAKTSAECSEQIKARAAAWSEDHNATHDAEFHACTDEAHELDGEASADAVMECYSGHRKRHPRCYEFDFFTEKNKRNECLRESVARQDGAATAET